MDFDNWKALHSGGLISFSVFPLFPAGNVDVTLCSVSVAVSSCIQSIVFYYRWAVQLDPHKLADLDKTVGLI